RDPYVETDEPNPLNAYGRSKLEGERAIQQTDGAYLILRASWVYSLRMPSFVTKFLGWARTNPQVRVVTDQTANPTWCRMLAETTAQLLAKMDANPAPEGWTRERRGVYHLAGSGYVSRFEMAQKMMELLPNDYPIQAKRVLPALTADFNDAAKRPVFSALDCGKFIRTFGIEIPDWESSLQAAFADHFQTVSA
ncbi:MAG: sugar nucleotide-binding protein, partial [Chloroflexota bacterium]